MSEGSKTSAAIAVSPNDHSLTVCKEAFDSRNGRRRNRQHETVEFSKAEWREINPTLPSLVRPWALLVLVAVGTTLLLLGSDSIAANSNDLASSFLSPKALQSFLIVPAENNDIHHLNQDDSSPHVTQRRLRKEHPPLLPLKTSDYWGFALATLGLMVAAGGGIGGGGILVPIFSLVFGFSAKHAISLSNVTVFAGAIANTIFNVSKRHPLADRPLVDWDLILVMEPLTIAGALIGAFLNKLLPESVLTILLVALLSFTAYESLSKAVKMYKIETIRLRQQGLRADGTKESELTKLAQEIDDTEVADASQKLLDDAEYQDSDDVDNDNTTKENQYAGNKGAEEENDMEEVELLETEASKKKQLDEILEYEKSVPMMNVKVLVALFIVVLAINLLKGGGAFPSPIGIVCGSASFWIANAIMLLWILVISVFVRAYLVNRYRIKQRVSYQYVEGDIKWDSRATIVYPIVCCSAGFFAGMFGVGMYRTRNSL
jgi:uncharacterized membrane protein YfcA